LEKNKNKFSVQSFFTPRSLKYLALSSIGLGVVIMIVFLVLLLWGNYKFSWFDLTNESIDLTYKIGSFLGSIIGPFWALAGVFLYYTALSYQKEDSKESRKAFEIQSFENTFFNLLSSQQNITQNIEGIFSTCKELEFTEFKVDGQDYFRLSKQVLTKLFESFNSEFYIGSFSENKLNNEVDDIERNYPDYEHEQLLAEENKRQVVKVINKTYNLSQEVWDGFNKKDDFRRLCKTYELYFNNHHQEIGHYFRHLYNILKFVDLSNKKFIENNIKFEAETYINFIQAQMSSYELMLLFYNILYFPKTRDLVIKYKMLDNLALEDLIDNCDHSEKTGITLKKRIELLNSGYTQDFKTNDKIESLEFNR